MYAMSEKCFGYLQNILYICSLKSLGKNINLRNIMNITLLKKSGTKEVINYLTLDGLVAARTSIQIPLSRR